MIKNISKTVKKPKVVKKLGKKRKASCAHVIVLGNEKGGSGKSTLAMHLIIGFLSEGKRVASVDCDARQGSLTRYILNRNKFNKKANGEYLLPNHFPLDPIGIETPDNAEIEKLQEKLQEKLSLLIEGALLNYDIILIDTPGSANQVSLLAHSYADTLITPMNDSFIDLDVIAHIDGYDMSVKGPSHYAELIWDARKMKADRDGGSIDWIVVRNRLSNLDAFNKRDIERLVTELTTRINFRTIPGLSERVIFRELFLLGLTILDLKDASKDKRLSPSHLAARSEILEIMNSIKIKKIRKTKK